MCVNRIYLLPPDPEQSSPREAEKKANIKDYKNASEHKGKKGSAITSLRENYDRDKPREGIAGFISEIYSNYN